MNRLVAFLRFLWDFVVGDDWRVALGVALAIAATAVVAAAGATAWWILPVVVAGLLSFSVLSVAKKSR
jgi:fatty acid desaturase